VQVTGLVKALENSLKGAGRVLLRPSGTEPLLRVMVEGTSESLVKQHAQRLCDEIGAIERNLGI
jgi:phosphoglucosamine mutase